MKLYKYRPINLNTLKILINESLVFSIPDKFNDPFDAKLFYKPIDTETGIKTFIDNLYAKGKMTKERHDEMLQTIDEWKRLAQSDEEFLEAISLPEKKEHARIQICCFSERFDNIQMWSHYANDHQGVCLGFKVVENPAIKSLVGFRMIGPDNIEKILQVRKVDYRRSPIEQIDRNKKDDLKQKYLQFLCTKEMNWKYEKEWRAFFPHKDETSLVKFPMETLTDLIFGLRTSEEEINTVIGILKQKVLRKNVTVWKMIEDQSKYRLLRARVYF